MAVVRAGDIVTIIDGASRYTVPHARLMSTIDNSIDEESVVTFRLAMPADPEEMTPSTALLDLCAAGKDDDSSDGESSVTEHPAQAADDDIIDPGADLIVSLREECRLWITRLSQTSHGGSRPMKSAVGPQQRTTSWLSSISMGAKFRCPLCPDRAFARGVRIVGHLQKYHTQRSCFSASGTKQVRVVMALYDADMFRYQAPQGDYLSRSAESIRRATSHSSRRRENDMQVDDDLRLLLARSGPRYVTRSLLLKTPALRVGNFYVTREFSTQVIRMVLLCNASFQRVVTTLAHVTAAQKPTRLLVAPRDESVVGWLHRYAPLIGRYGGI